MTENTENVENVDPTAQETKDQSPSQPLDEGVQSLGRIERQDQGELDEGVKALGHVDRPAEEPEQPEEDVTLDDEASPDVQPDYDAEEVDESDEQVEENEH